MFILNFMDCLNIINSVIKTTSMKNEMDSIPSGQPYSRTVRAATREQPPTHHHPNTTAAPSHPDRHHRRTKEQPPTHNHPNTTAAPSQPDRHHRRTTSVPSRSADTPVARSGHRSRDNSSPTLQAQRPSTPRPRPPSPRNPTQTPTGAGGTPSRPLTTR